MAGEIHGELQVPPAVINDKQAVELLRVWLSGGKQHISIRYDAWDDSAVWGLLLVDLARMVAQGHAQNQGRDANAVLGRIKEAFDAEWSFPTGSGSD